MLSFIRQKLSTEIQRYSRTRQGKLVALLIYYLLFTQIPPIVSIFIPLLLAKMTPIMAYTATVFITKTVVSILFNGAMYFVYTAELPFFEQYRVNKDKPWLGRKMPRHGSNYQREVQRSSFSIFLKPRLFCQLEPQTGLLCGYGCESIPTNGHHALSLGLFLLHCTLGTTSTTFVQIPQNSPQIHHNYLSGRPIFTFCIISGCLFAPCWHLHESGPSIRPSTCEHCCDMADTAHVGCFNGHCRYVFSWAPLQLLPFCANDDCHDFHHSHNAGNYGSQFHFLDTIFGINRNFKSYKKALKAKQQ